MRRKGPYKADHLRRCMLDGFNAEYKLRTSRSFFLIIPHVGKHIRGFLVLHPMQAIHTKWGQRKRVSDQAAVVYAITGLADNNIIHTKHNAAHGIRIDRSIILMQRNFQLCGMMGCRIQ